MNFATDTHEKQNELSRLYHASLEQYLKQGAVVDMELARQLGNRAMAIGLETLDLARIHEIALVALVLPDSSSVARSRLIGLAGLFFAEAITPIEQTHRGAREANAHLKHIVRTLGERTLELADSVEMLKQENLQRQAVEASLRASEQTSSDLLEKSRRMQSELRELSRQLLTAQEEERMKISRELHDVIAQTLTGINVRLGTLKAEASASSKQLQNKISSTQRLVEKSVDIVHRFACELRPTVLDDLGLIPALKSFLKSFIADTGVRVSLKVSSEVEQSSSAIRTTLYRVAQEALNNVSRHAHASRAEVSIRFVDGIICMEITDNGSGFDVEATPDGNKPARLGLLGMRERVEMVGGTLLMDSVPGSATTIRVEIPSGNASAGKSQKQ
ncbi:MAG: sensor histidine kinase [Verrucomicrobiae bacterium]